MSLINPLTVQADYSLLVNGETNSLDWYIVLMWSDGAKLNMNKELDSSQMAAAQPSQGVFVPLELCVDNAGRVSAITHWGRFDSVDAGVVVSRALIKNTTVTGLTSLQIVSNQTNGIGAGSLFVIERVA
jgi:hypothetical protein